MMAAKIRVLHAALLIFIGSCLAQNYNQYSLQPAVDALHRRQAQLWLGASDKHRRNYNAEQDHQQKLDNIYAQMWANYGNPDEPDMEEEFEEHKRFNIPNERELMLDRVNQERQRLKDIESQRFAEYVNNIEDRKQRLFQQMQQQENDLQDELYGNPAGGAANYNELRNSQSGPVAEESRVAEKRRLVMPWLPVRKRSFPMSKRSPAFPKLDASISGTNEKVAHDLQRIFSAPVVADRIKTKRSSGVEQNVASTTTTTTTTVKPPADESKIDSNARLQRDQNDNHDLDHDGYLGEHDHGHRRNHDHGHSHEHEHEHEHDHEHHENPEHDHEHEDEHEDDEGEDHAHEHDEEEDHDSGEDNSDEQEDRKKKRAIINMAKRGNQEVLKEDQIIPGDLTDFKRKKSVEWSKYIGIDRRKKSTDWAKADKPKTLEDYTPTHFRNHDQVVARTKQDVNDKKLDNMDQELKTIEELIIDETIKFTSEHEGMTNADDIQKLRDHVISRLATAYSLEKMRRALEKLKQSVDLERHLTQNEVEGLRNAAADIGDDDDDDALDKYKRVAIKKEKVEYDNNQHIIDAVTDHILNANALKTNPHDDNYNFGEDSAPRTAEKKSNFMPMMTVQHDNHHRNGPAAARSYNKRPSSDLQQYSPIEEYANNAVDDECPVLDAMEKRCRAINLISGDIHQQFVMQCGVHQLCYLCGTSQTACDYQYMVETTAICGDNMECLSSAQSALIIMRETPGQHIGPRECERHSCLKRALIEIGAL